MYMLIGLYVVPRAELSCVNIPRRNFLICVSRTPVHVQELLLLPRLMLMLHTIEPGSLEYRIPNMIKPQPPPFHERLTTACNEFAHRTTTNRRLDVRLHCLHLRMQRCYRALWFERVALDAKILYHILTIRDVDFVHLGQDDLVANTGQSQRSEQRAVLVLDAVFRVQQDEDATKLFPILDILHDLCSPGREGAVAVARHVYKRNARADELLVAVVLSLHKHTGAGPNAVEVHRLGEASGCACAREEGFDVGVNNGV